MSGGIGVASSHLPLTKRKKSSWGRTDRSMPARSMPNDGSLGAVCADSDSTAASVTNAMRKGSRGFIRPHLSKPVGRHPQRNPRARGLPRCIFAAAGIHEVLRKPRINVRLLVLLTGLLVLTTHGFLSAQSLAIVDVNVVPMDREATIASQTVVVRGERIVAIGPRATTPVPDDAVVVSGAGRFLVPGLTDAHLHLAGTFFSPGRPQFGDAPLYLAYGVTTVFNLGGSPDQLEWRRRILAGEMIAPTIYTSPPFFNEPLVNTPDEVEREIAVIVADGYDLLKFREIVGFNPAPTTVGLSRPAYRTMNEAARRANLPLVGHAPVNLGLEAMLEARQHSLAHVGELNRLYFNPVVRERWSLIAGGFGLAISVLRVIASVLLAAAQGVRRATRPGVRASWPPFALAIAGLVAAVCYGTFSTGGPLFDRDGLRAVFTLAALVIAGTAAVLIWRRSWLAIPAIAMTYWVVVWTPIAWRSSRAGIEELARRIKEAGIVVQTTLINYETFSAAGRPSLARDPAIDYLQPSAREPWRQLPTEVTGLQSLNRYPEFTRAVTAALHRAGVPLLAGTDALGLPLITPGTSLHRELELLHDAGLTRFEVLHSATAAPAAFLGKSDEFGTIQAGRRADLLLVEGNPLDDLSVLRRPIGVVVRGHWLPRDQLNAMLEGLRR